MAAEDLSDPPAIATTLPLYPEMIVSAIEALNDKNGSNKSSITKQIESTYGPLLPPTHATLVSHHLTEMQQSGHLSLLNNNYLLPTDPASPPKRGRGRPPKPKSAVSAPSGPPRPRGRPPKVAVDQDTVSPAPSAGGSGRGRGRPPKRAKVGGGAVASAAVAGVKRGRGRPPKAKAALAEVEI